MRVQRGEDLEVDMAQVVLPEAYSDIVLRENGALQAFIEVVVSVPIEPRIIDAYESLGVPVFIKSLQGFDRIEDN